MENNKRQEPRILTFKDVKPVYKNFSGMVDEYNESGARNFSILLDREIADDLASQGFNVKYPKHRPDANPNEEDNRLPYIQVNVTKDNVTPLNDRCRIFVVDGDVIRRIPNQDLLQVSSLDKRRIESLDVEVIGYEWERMKRRGIVLYASVIYVKLDTRFNDPFAKDYADYNREIESPIWLE